MKTKNVLKKIMALILCTTITLNTCTTSLGESICSIKIENMKQEGFNAVIQCENFDKNCKSFKINGDIVNTKEIISLNDGIMSNINEQTTNMVDQEKIEKDIFSTMNNIYSSNEYCVKAESISIYDIIVAENGISFDADKIYGDSAIIYSKKQDITITANCVDFSGLIYAPNGTVRFDGNDININGIIIAQNIVVQAEQFNVSYDYESAILVEDLEYVKFDNRVELSMYFDNEKNSIILQWGEENKLKQANIYARNDNLGFKEIASIQSNSFEFNGEDIEKFVDFRLVGISKYGEEVVSNILTICKKENEFYIDEIDSDNDQIPDGYEYLIGTNPEKFDTDNDGFPDGYEANILCTNPLEFDIDDDFDGDGVLNQKELKEGTNPYQIDSDFDGITDSIDPNPTKADVEIEREINYDVCYKQGMFDLVTQYLDESNHKCKIIYNYLTGKIKYLSDSESESYNIYNDDYQLIALIKKSKTQVFANTYSYIGDNLETATHNGVQYLFHYDSEGNLAEVKIGDESLVINQYDNGLLTEKLYGNATEVKFKYNDIGNLLEQKINDICLYEWIYDEDGNIISYKDHTNGVNSFYSYDELGDIEEIKTTEGFKISYNTTETTQSTIYQNSNEIKEQSITLPLEDENEAVELATVTKLISDEKLISIVSDKNVEKTIMSNENKVLGINYTLSENGFSKIEYNDGTWLNYSYDNNGNIIQIQENGENKYNYEYDSCGQLLRENNLAANRTWLYSYDSAGNILSTKEYYYTMDKVGECLCEKKLCYESKEWEDLLTNANGQVVTYDAIGNPLSYRDGMYFSWIGRQLSNVRNGDSEISYTYNSEGIRTSKTVAGIKTTYQLEESKIISETTDKKVKWYIYDENDEIIGFETDETYYFEKNGQGDVIKIINENGEFVSEYIYDAWGNIVSIHGNVKIAEENPFRYRGYYYDNETTFYYLQSRYYDSYTGRFLNPDEKLTDEEHILGLNLFAYCNNNCVNKVDYDGKEAISYYLVVFLVGSLLIAVCSVLIISNVQKNWNKAYSSTMDYFLRSIDSLTGLATAVANSLTGNAKQIYKTVEASLAGTKTKPNYKKNTEVHHIVAKEASNASRAREILQKFHIKYKTDSRNLVEIKTGLHRRLHTKKYYGWANSVVISAYNAAGNDEVKQRKNVLGALETLRALILVMNKMSPY